jgi:(E)-4-hydroxy-3-methylbut-2-enyl-diphosphate synthase
MKRIRTRKETRRVWVGKIPLGGGAPVSVQSMTNTKTEDVEATVTQIRQLRAAGCDIVRVAIPNRRAAEAISSIREQIGLPLVADIHFDYRLALAAIDAGADKIRINPGNIGDRARVEAILERAATKGIPIRIGVNAGSLEKELLSKYGGPTAEAMVASAVRHLELCESVGFRDVVLSLKASDVMTTVRAYRMIAAETDCPLHLGITEAGTARTGSIRSAVGLGILLAEGIGDTIRVSLTADPVEEVKVGIEILRSLGLRSKGVTVISCPTCGRAEVDLVSIAEEVEKRLAGIEAPLHVAVMGCAVNGPGEARAADVGIACGRGSGLLFVRGEVVRKVPESQIVDVLVEEVQRLASQCEGEVPAEDLAEAKA